MEEDNAIKASKFSALVVLLMLTTAPYAFSADETPSGDPSGTITMTFGRGAFIVTAGGGHGTLTYNNVSYKFKIIEAGIGGIGGAKVIATGNVYNLNNIKIFQGHMTT